MDAWSHTRNRPETSVFYQRRAFEPEVSAVAMLCRAFEPLAVACKARDWVPINPPVTIIDPMNCGNSSQQR
jgi:hypothetical protein